MLEGKASQKRTYVRPTSVLVAAELEALLVTGSVNPGDNDGADAGDARIRRRDKSSGLSPFGDSTSPWEDLEKGAEAIDF